MQPRSLRTFHSPSVAVASVPKVANLANIRVKKCEIGAYHFGGTVQVLLKGGRSRDCTVAKSV